MFFFYLYSMIGKAIDVGYGYDLIKCLHLNLVALIRDEAH